MKTRIEFMGTNGRPALQTSGLLSKRLRSPLFASIGLRPILAQHTCEEDSAIRQAARGRRSAVEIGVAEGASAAAIRQEMAADGTLYLIDPFHLTRWKSINGMRRAARRSVNSGGRGRVVWVEEFSHDAARHWSTAIDFLLFDGDHAEDAVRRDWHDWHPFVIDGGVVVFHDARVFEGGWPALDWGPVKLVNELFRQGASPTWRIVREVHSIVVVQRGQ